MIGWLWIRSILSHSPTPRNSQIGERRTGNKDMAVFRVIKNKNYSTVSNVCLRDKNLSLKAKGLLTLMLSLPDDWDYSISGLCSICKEEKAAIQSAIAELEKSKYVVRLKTRSRDGRFNYVYDIYETPRTENPFTVNPCTENPPQINTNKLITDSPNTEPLKKERKKESGYGSVFKSKNVDGELKKAFIEFIKSRALNKQKLTDRALELAIEKVRQLEKAESRQIAVINQSIVNGWRGLFPLKDDQTAQPTALQTAVEVPAGLANLVNLWDKALGTRMARTSQNIEALQRLVEEEGEEKVRQMIGALMMRSQHSYLTSNLTSISTPVQLATNRAVVWQFYMKNHDDWREQMEKKAQGKARWEL